jgi:hypothetical protein
MTCPRCGEIQNGAPLRCSACDFALISLDQRLGAHTVALERINDTAHCLRLKDQRRLDALIDDFERRLPQCFCSLYFGVLPSGINVAEAGFWLLNHGLRYVGNEMRPSSFGIVIVIDPAAHCAGVSLGYGLEQLLPQHRVAAALHKNSQHLWHGEYGDAVAGLLHDIERGLRSHGQAERRQISQPPKQTAQAALLPGTTTAAPPPPERSRLKPQAPTHSSAS